MYGGGTWGIHDSSVIKLNHKAKLGLVSYENNMHKTKHSLNFRSYRLSLLGEKKPHVITNQLTYNMTE